MPCGGLPRRLQRYLPGTGSSLSKWSSTIGLVCVCFGEKSPLAISQLNICALLRSRSPQTPSMQGLRRCGLALVLSATLEACFPALCRRRQGQQGTRAPPQTGGATSLFGCYSVFTLLRDKLCDWPGSSVWRHHGSTQRLKPLQVTSSRVQRAAGQLNTGRRERMPIGMTGPCPSATGAVPRMCRG